MLLIKQGSVFVNSKKVIKPSFSVSKEDVVEVDNNIEYVSRGYLKIEDAFNKFNFEIENKKALDIGSSTGGFTQFLLDNNIKAVTSVDVGSNQMSEKIKKDKRVILRENTNIKNFNESTYELIVIDLSFISLTKITNKIADLLKKDGKIFALIKPQFELGNKVIGNKGVVKDRDLFIKAVKNVISSFNDNNLFLNNIDISSILGKKGNHEVISLFSFGNKNILLDDFVKKTKNILK